MNSVFRSETLVVLVGWLGSKERQLQNLSQFYQSLGCSTLVHIPNTFRMLGHPNGFSEEGEILRKKIENHPQSKLLIHTFSNAGFWASTSLLRSLRSEKILGAIVDCAPGFDSETSWREFQRLSAMALLPSLLSAQGKKPAHTDAFWTPWAERFLGLWALVSPRKMHFIRQAPERFARCMGSVPILTLQAGNDLLIPHETVERFAKRAARSGAKFEKIRFAEAEHVRIGFSNRLFYRSQIREWIIREGF